MGIGVIILVEFLHKMRPRLAAVHMIYTWLQVNGVCH